MTLMKAMMKLLQMTQTTKVMMSPYQLSQTPAAESMESDTKFQEVDIAAIEKAMEKVTTGLRMVGTGYEELRPVMRAMPIHEIPKLFEQLPQPILDPIPDTI